MLTSFRRDGAYVVAGKVVDGGFGEHAVVCEMC